MGLLQKLFGKEVENNKEWVAFATGELQQLSEAPDPVFSSLSMGNGVAITPDHPSICSPVSGEITMIFPTKHAFGIKNDLGIELLIHIGVDTVNLKGKGFTFYKKVGDTIRAGERIADIDLQFIKSAGFNPTIMMIVTNDNHHNLDYQENNSVIGGKSIIARIGTN